MMIWISPPLAAVSVVIIPLALVITMFIARRSQVQFADQWDQTGLLNGLVEETHTGHALVQAFGRRRAAVEEFSRQNRRMYEASFRAQFLSGVIQPSMQVQDTWLSPGTIRENIRYSRPDATDEEIVAAARAARADYFIRTLPGGYDTRSAPALG